MAADTTLLSIVTTLLGREQALAMARAAVEARLAACAQVDEAAITSVYRWQGDTCESSEWRLTFKTLPRCEPALRALVAGLHPYEVPQWIATKMIADHAYLAWATGEIGPEAGP